MELPINSRVFISYTHDSDAHRSRVLEFADQLNNEGIDCWCDQYIEDGTPEQGWPKWMEENIREAKYVLVICTRLYYDRYEGREAVGRGKGSKFESVILTQWIYDNDSRNLKFIPVLFERSDEEYIITPLRSTTHYSVSNKTSFEELYARLTGQWKAIRPTKPAVGSVRLLTSVHQEDTIPTAKTVDSLDIILDTEQLEPVAKGDTLAETESRALLPVIHGFTDVDMHPNLKIAQAFFGQPVTRRFTIASQLGLLAPGEVASDINRDDVAAQILLRAKAQGLLGQLWTKLFNERLDPNPFK